MLKQVLEAFTPNLILFISLVCTYTHASVICFPAEKYNSFSSGSFSLLFCFFWWTDSWVYSGNCISVAEVPRSAATFVSISILLLKYNLLAQLDHFSLQLPVFMVPTVHTDFTHTYSEVLTSDNASMVFQFPQTFLTAAHYPPYAYTCSFLLSVQHLGH